MPERTAESRSINYKAVLAIVLAAVALVFIIQNTTSKRVHLLFWSTSMPAWIWLLGVFLAGVLAGTAFPWLRPRKR